MMNSPIERKRAEMLHSLFNEFSLADQRSYYAQQVQRNRTAATQVNRIRATFALFTGLASAMAGLIVLLHDSTCPISDGGASVNPDCTWVLVGVNVLLLIAVVAPAIGGAFGTLADLFQWDRLVKIYEVALENLEVADAKSPLDEMPDARYAISLKAYSEGVLAVMRDETAQWGQVIRTPESIERFIEREMERVQRAVSNQPPEVQAQVKADLEALRTSAEETKRLLEELRANFQPGGAAAQPAPGGAAGDQPAGG